MKRKPKSEVLESPNQVLVMNGRLGRITMTKARQKSKGNFYRLSWFPPRDDVKTARVANREVGVTAGEGLAELHGFNPGLCYSCAMQIIRTRGPDAVEAMRHRLDEERSAGQKFASANTNNFTNAAARMVRVRGVG